MREAGGGAATSPRAPSRAAAICCSLWRLSSQALHLQNRERVSGRGGGGETEGGEGAPWQMMRTARQSSGEDRRLPQDGTACVAVPAASEGPATLEDSRRGRAHRGCRGRGWGREEILRVALGEGGEAGTGMGRKDAPLWLKSRTGRKHLLCEVV